MFPHLSGRRIRTFLPRSIAGVIITVSSRSTGPGPVTPEANAAQGAAASAVSNCLLMIIVDFTEELLEEAAAAYAQAFNSEPWNDGWTQDAATERLERMMRHPDSLGLAAIEGELLGFACGWRERWLKADHFHLKEMCVVPDRQRSGIGSALLVRLLSRLDHLGVEACYLQTRPRTPAAYFYEKHGFRGLNLQSMFRTVMDER